MSARHRGVSSSLFRPQDPGGEISTEVGSGVMTPTKKAGSVPVPVPPIGGGIREPWRPRPVPNGSRNGSRTGLPRNINGFSGSRLSGSQRFPQWFPLSVFGWFPNGSRHGSAFSESRLRGSRTLRNLTASLTTFCRLPLPFAVSAAMAALTVTSTSTPRRSRISATS